MRLKNCKRSALFVNHINFIFGGLLRYPETETFDHDYIKIFAFIIYNCTKSWLQKRFQRFRLKHTSQRI